MMAGPWHQSFLTDLADVQATLNGCPDAEAAAAQRVPDPGVGHVSSGGGQCAEDRLSARRTHKADREKLRRDRLNEQFSELASALDPDRPKNDKATILGESIQVVKELREDVKRLKMEHTSLLDESADLTQEKNELREERATLRTETERLQNQLQQRLRPWMTMDSSLVMDAAAPYPYTIPIPQPVPLGETDSHQLGVARPPLVNPTSYIRMAPPMSSFHLHSLQPYMPYPTFPPPPPTTVTSHSHIERPYAQYPSSVQPHIPGYVVPIPSSQGSPATGSPAYRPCIPGIPVIPVNHNSTQVSKDSSDHPHTLPSSSSQHAPAEIEHENADIVSPQLVDSQEAAPAQDSSVGDIDLRLHEGEIPKSPSISSSTFSLKEKLEFSLDRTNFNTGGHSNDLVDISHSSQDCPANIHDPTLRPPAA